ncbi:uncharacterized protein LOC105429019 [Pogonomyrmex barbatus]|uniref:Uncharacterized protein LOC105429019 n=1 Tax=Pogonomyrmex barbatus TaxID=144034 RepID=A0A6I9X6A6_9HYME|nr:uncharacterized protein LOC105429019 [Pogonomyrmex barbatus]
MGSRDEEKRVYGAYWKSMRTLACCHIAYAFVRFHESNERERRGNNRLYLFLRSFYPYSSNSQSTLRSEHHVLPYQPAHFPPPFVNLRSESAEGRVVAIVDSQRRVGFDTAVRDTAATFSPLSAALDPRASFASRRSHVQAACPGHRHPSRRQIEPHRRRETGRDTELGKMSSRSQMTTMNGKRPSSLPSRHQPETLAQHFDLIKYIYDSWNSVSRELDMCHQSTTQ